MKLGFDRRRTLRFLRHGATAANHLRLRCGGDLDLALTEIGRAQAAEAARRIVALDPPVRMIVTSDLRRTRETAEIIARAVGGVEIVVDPEFTERRLGEWNLRPIDQTEPWLERDEPPRGGESRIEFTDRIARALRRLMVWLPEKPLLVSSKGVGRVLGELSRMPRPLHLDNAELTEFDFAVRPGRTTKGRRS